VFPRVLAGAARVLLINGDEGSGNLIEVQGTAEGEPFSQERLLDLLALARTIFTHLGMVPFLQRADALPQRLQPSAPEAPQKRHPVYADARSERVASIFNRVSQTRTRFLA
jgi:hypothetical protein